jgi:rare lipoprotein A
LTLSNTLIRAVIVTLVFAGGVLMYQKLANGSMVLASFYGEELRGNATASGERFDPDLYTAAHRTIPLQEWATICRDAEGCVEVRINDRGPWSFDREIDLSRAAAEELGIDEEGIAPVEIHAA